MNEQRSPGVSHDKATASPVPLSDWRSVHELASRVRQHEPWRILTETDLFALEDPVTKKVGLISVRGRYGEVYGIELYLPPEGLLFWLQLFRNGETDPTLSKYELRKLDATFVRIKRSKYLESLDFFISELDTAVTRVDASKPGIISKIIDALREKRDQDEISKLANSKTIYHLKITLRHSDPPIWRTLQVSGDVRLSDLHQIFQIAMGWCNEHLHDFRVGSIIYGDPTMVAGGEDENLMTLSQIAPRKASRFIYTYDFGDNWVHDVLVQRVERGVGPVAPRCTGGQIACPPEDCGGICGYTRLLESLANPADPNRGETIEWLGEDYDPVYFNPEEVNDIFASFAAE